MTQKIEINSRIARKINPQTRNQAVLSRLEAHGGKAYKTHNDHNEVVGETPNKKKPNFLLRRAVIGGAALLGAGAVANKLADANDTNSPSIPVETTVVEINDSTKTVWQGVTDELINSGYVDKEGNVSVDVRPYVDEAVRLNDMNDDGEINKSFKVGSLQVGQQVIIPDIAPKS